MPTSPSGRTKSTRLAAASMALIRRIGPPQAANLSPRQQRRDATQMRDFTTGVKPFGALGGMAEGTARDVAKRTTLAEYSAKTGAGRDHVEALSSALASFGKSVRQSIGKSDELGDADTTDLSTEVSRGVDKWLWFVEAHLQSER